MWNRSPAARKHDSQNEITTNGSAGTTSDLQEVFAYNARGEATVKVDRNQTIHAYTYDDLGRLRADRVTSTGSGVDRGV